MQKSHKKKIFKKERPKVAVPFYCEINIFKISKNSAGHPRHTRGTTSGSFAIKKSAKFADFFILVFCAFFRISINPPVRPEATKLQCQKLCKGFLFHLIGS